MKGGSLDTAFAGNASSRGHRNGRIPPQSQTQNAARLGFFGPGTDCAAPYQRPLGMARLCASGVDGVLSKSALPTLAADKLQPLGVRFVAVGGVRRDRVDLHFLPLIG